MNAPAAGAGKGEACVTVADLDRFCRAVLAAVGCDTATVEAATRAMMHGSRLGVDSHGMRLLPHYVAVFEGGRVARKPAPRIVSAFGAVALLDVDHGHGALGAHLGMRRAIELADAFGIGAVAIRNSSHFGPAGAFALEAAEAGCIGLAMCNSDSFVRLHDGAMRFHGTNPIACAAPVEGGRPWLLDMATSAIPYNRIQLYRSLGRNLPEGTASLEDGVDTRDTARVAMLAPLGGPFGFKGAGLAGMVELFSALLSGMKPDFDLLPMGGPDLSTPRGLGAFVMAIRPEAFGSREVFQRGMERYLAQLRGSPARAGGTVLAPGDREWAEADRRAREGVPLDPATSRAFARLAERFGIAPPRPAGKKPAGRKQRQ